MPTDTDRGPGRAEASPGLPAEGLFHQPIFQGAVGEDHQRASRAQEPHTAWGRARERFFPSPSQVLLGQLQGLTIGIQAQKPASLFRDAPDMPPSSHSRVQIVRPPPHL